MSRSCATLGTQACTSFETNVLPAPVRLAACRFEGFALPAPARVKAETQSATAIAMVLLLKMVPPLLSQFVFRSIARMPPTVWTVG